MNNLNDNNLSSLNVEIVSNDEDINSEHETILIEAKERFEIANEGWNLFRNKSQDLLKFISGEQWDQQLKMNRQNAGLPALTCNKIEPFVNQITNEIRKNTPSIQYSPKDDIASIEAADILGDFVRTIQNDSAADTAYDTSVSYAAKTGIGYIRVTSDYISDDSFDQKLIIKAVDDPNTVLLDPTHRSPVGEDCEYAFVLTTISRSDYMRTYPDSKLANSTSQRGWQADGTWVTEHEVLIAEYYYKKYETRLLHLVYNNILQTTENTFEPDAIGLEDGTLMIIKTREVQQPTIYWCKLNETEILEETTWPGTIIPIIPVKCNETWAKGKRILKGLVEDAVDAQRAYNYFLSLQAELVQLAPKAPFVGEIRQFANFEKLWREANVAPNAYLPYNAVSLDGTPLPPPQRQSVEAPIQAAGSLCAQASDTMKAIFNLYDPAMGKESNETSGKAILARTAQSHNANFHLGDNLNRSIVQVGKVLLEAIPVFYDNERLIHLTDEAGETEPMYLNSDKNQDPGSKSIDFSKGKFNVSIDAGASYSTKRQEAVESMMALGDSYPQAMPLISDILVENMDWPGHQRIAARLRAAVPPEILAITERDQKMQPEQVVIQLQQQLQQQSQALEALNAHAEQVEQELQVTKNELKLVKLDQTNDMQKAQADYDINMRKIALEEEKTELEVKIELKKIALEDRKLDIQEAKAAYDINASIHDKSVDHIDRKSESTPLSMSDIDDVSDNDTDLGGDLTRNGI